MEAKLWNHLVWIYFSPAFENFDYHYRKSQCYKVQFLMVKARHLCLREGDFIICSYLMNKKTWFNLIPYVYVQINVKLLNFWDTDTLQPQSYILTGSKSSAMPQFLLVAVISVLSMAAITEASSHNGCLRVQICPAVWLTFFHRRGSKC